MNIEELKALAEIASTGQWEHYILDKPLSEVPAYVAKCIESSGGGQDFYFVIGTHPDGNPADICHVGNGVKSPANAAYIAAANPAAILELIAQLEDAQSENRALLATEQNLRERVKELEEGLTKLMREFPTDFDMKEAGWDGADIERACSAHDNARALLEKQK